MLGEGILKGLAETARNFFGSYVEQGPADHGAVSGRARCPASRPRATFLSSSTTAPIRKPACAASPARSAKRNARRSASTSKRARTRSPTPSASRSSIPRSFNIDISVCMSCQICVEVCPFDAIKMDVEFELSTDGPLRRPAARQAPAGQVERVLPPDSSHRSRRR